MLEAWIIDELQRNERRRKEEEEDARPGARIDPPALPEVEEGPAEPEPERRGVIVIPL